MPAHSSGPESPGAEQMQGKRIAIIGAGAMGEALVSGILGAQICLPAQVSCSHPRSERREELSAAYGITCHADNQEAARRADVVLLSVKPQVTMEVAHQLRPALQPGTIFISIAAGVSLTALQLVLGDCKIVRAMTNTPARCGAGTTMWYAGETVTPEERGLCAALFGSLGLQIETSREEQLALATAISGTGPMYVFLFIEALVEAAVRLGLPRHLGRELVLSTITGAAEFAAGTSRHSAQLRDDVTSPGGTSAAALYELDRGRFRTVLHDAVAAAFERATELEGSINREAQLKVWH